MSCQGSITVKDETRMLIDGLPDDAASGAIDSLRWLADEPAVLTEADLAEVRLGEAEIARGEFVTLNELRRQLAG